jgi:hypothetical protein
MSKFNLKQHLLETGNGAKKLKKRILAEPDNPSHLARVRSAEGDLINAESTLGRTVFGPVMPGHQREFFLLKKNVWIWYENGKTIRYEVRESGVYKKVDTGNYAKISGKELENFRAATKAYLQLLKMNLYKA